MSPPFIPRALIAAVAPPADYEVIEGDLYEEYVARLHSVGAAEANRWYWAQAVRSVPALLSYSRTTTTIAGSFAIVGIVVGVLFCMLFAKDLIDSAVDRLSRHAMPAEVYFMLDWVIAAAFGIVLAALIRTRGARLALGASIFMLVAFALPILAGVSPRLPLGAWVLLLGAIPAMTLGAAAFQVVRRR